MVKIQDAAQARIAALKDEGSIRLGSSAWGLDLVVDTLPAFKERFPAFTVRIYENRYAETKAMMRAGTLDLAIIAVTEDDDLPAQGYTPLCQEELSLILPVDHPFCTAAPAGPTSPRMCCPMSWAASATCSPTWAPPSGRSRRRFLRT